MVYQVDHTIKSTDEGKVDLARPGTVVDVCYRLFFFNIESPYLNHLNTKIESVFRFGESFLKSLLISFFSRHRFYLVNK